jgi:hypothetical protein
MARFKGDILREKRTVEVRADEFGIEDHLAADGRRLTVSGMYINPGMGEGRYQDTLRRQLKRLPLLPLDGYDCTDTGSKNTECSWGLCSDSFDLYPAPDDHMFPEDMVQRGRSAPRGTPGPCPLDGRITNGENGCLNSMSSGQDECFYKCLFFRPKWKQKRIEHKAALHRYREVLADREARFGKKTTEDDGEAHWAQDYELNGVR